MENAFYKMVEKLLRNVSLIIHITYIAISIISCLCFCYCVPSLCTSVICTCKVVLHITYFSFLKSLAFFLLTWFNFNLCMDKLSHAQSSADWNFLFILKLQRLPNWRLGMDKSFHPTLYNKCNYVSVVELKLSHVSKISPSKLATTSFGRFLSG